MTPEERLRLQIEAAQLKKETDAQATLIRRMARTLITALSELEARPYQANLEEIHKADAVAALAREYRAKLRRLDSLETEISLG